ncbi:hypothetical protein EJ02DRAFT_472772, partial [Clathrospora elynae]
MLSYYRGFDVLTAFHGFPHRPLQELLRQQIAVVTYFRARKIRRFTLQSWLYTLNTQLCPHMHTKSSEFQRQLAEHAVNKDGSIMLPITKVFAAANVSALMSMECSELHCSTSVVIRRWYDVDNEPLTADVHRQLGKIERVTDPVWCVQVQTE